MEQTKQNTPNKWVIFLVTVFGSIAVAISQFKVTGTMPQIIAAWGIDVGTAGLLMSVPSIANLLIALPAGAITKKIGPRNAFLITLASAIVFGIIGAFATNFTVLVITRFFEGLSIGMVFVVPPVIFAQTFPAEKRGLPMSLWAIWSSIGTLIILNLCNLVTPAFGWQANWWVAVAFLVVAFILCFFFLKMPGTDTAQGRQNAAAQKKKGAWGECLKNPAAICICIAFFASIFGWGVYTTYYPTYLTTSMGLPSTEANSISSIHTYLMIFIALTFGFVLNKVANRNHPKLFLMAIVLDLIGFVMIWTMPSIPLDIVGILFAAAGMQCCGPLAHNLIPDAVPPEAVPIGMGMISFSSGLGGVLGIQICGGIVSATSNWALVAVPTGGVAAVGIIAAIVVVAKLGKKPAEVQPTA